MSRFRWIQGAAAVALLGLTSGAVLAGPSCTTEPRDKWMSEAAMQERIKADGYTIAKFKVTKGNCYEIYGTDKHGKRVEIYFNPVDGKEVERH